jgi:hypothetical protein
MFRENRDAPVLHVFYSLSARPLAIWQHHLENGFITRVLDWDIRSSVVQIVSTNVPGSFVTCPKDPNAELGISLPFVVLVLKFLGQNLKFEFEIRDDTNTRRRFRASTSLSRTRVRPDICTLPMRLDPGWSQINFNLADFTQKAYGTNYVGTVRVTVFASCRIRRIYFADRLYTDSDLPPESRHAPGEPEDSEASMQLTWPF